MRNNSIDIIRGALMLYIVAIIHGVFWLRIIPRPYSSLLLFEMPLIFIVSGYSYALFQKNTRFKLHIKNYFAFSINRCSRILIPYFAYAAVCAAMVVMLSNDESRQADVLTILYTWVNPLTYGRGHTYLWLSWHLWFIAPFLIVTLLLPFLTMHHSFNPPLWLAGIIVCIIIFAMEGSSFAGKVNKPLFYLFWAWFGYQLANGVKIRRNQCLMIALLGIIMLIISKLFFDVTLDMQSNKFPPNLLFFIFSSVWVSLFLLIISYIDPINIEFLAKSKWFKPFIASGYSIYLWQGFGYTTAKFIGSKENISIYLIWFLAIIFTIIMGVIFGPLENIRIRVNKKT